MSLKEYSKEQLQETSLIEIAFELLRDRKEAIAFKEIMDELTNLLELSDEQVRAKIAQFYTDLNIDGRFLGLGDNRWGLRVWYPIDQVEEEVVTQIKPKKKKAKKVKEDEDLDDYDELDEEEIDYDDIDDFEEEDEILEDDDLLEDDEELEDEELIEKDEEFDLDEDDEELEEDEVELDDEDDNL